LSKTSDLLFLAQRIPFPPEKGDKIRSWNFLKHLAGRYRVHLGCFFDEPDDARYISELESICASVCCLPINRRWARLRSLKGIAKGTSLSEEYFRDGRLRRWVEAAMRRHRPERIFVFSSSMAPYAVPYEGARRIFDMVDVDSVKWGAYAGTKSWPVSLVYERERRTLLGLERAAANEFDLTLLVSRSEVDAFLALAPEAAPRVTTLPNGVDLRYFDPGPSYPNPFQDAGLPLLFTGTMDYWPNIEAVDWFARGVFPSLRQRHPRIEFWIVGSRPTLAVRRLARLPGVRVTGRVRDVRPFLAHCAAVVVPLRIARGVQNKMLEAMAMAKPIVATSQACEGLDGVARGEIVQCSTAAEFAAAIDLVTSGAGREIGQRARARAEADFQWATSLARLDRLLEDGTAAEDARVSPKASEPRVPVNSTARGA